jgi:hypothetical protein
MIVHCPSIFDKKAEAICASNRKILPTLAIEECVQFSALLNGEKSPQTLAAVEDVQAGCCLVIGGPCKDPLNHHD